ncbi:glycosyl transferase family 90 [Paracoccus sp. 1_MG-2023]|uniref:glycosyl transferase family 90 n=1 Tax=unclassified Paracoccus (in: a-proteobacteria) TaxID=2688777 RepID=UPI001C093BD7|nr:MULTISPECIES: glycosyl transferase family 90 [unclassified Paracoccus (in: a-proteobacteria)]MBU2956176.1 hypothetical protein [Paracoccus sp. C2R09]MDO6667853.1 glycosyl transferase family 90 [Paracoccus sp. 1_MG-2023]
MRDGATGGKLFQIGFNKCGTTFIAKLFDMNGIPAAHWLEGALAEDIAYSRLTGRRPLARWADSVQVFTDMESVRFLNMPVVEAFKEYALLDRHYPGSVFLLNTRDRDDWIASRYLHRGGAYARSFAASSGVGLGGLADIWAQDWDRHLAGVRAHFAGRPELVEIDIDHAAPGDYRDALAPWFDLPICLELPGKGVRRARADRRPLVARMAATRPLGRDIDDDTRRKLAERLAANARPARSHAGRGAPLPAAVCLDLDAGRVRTPEGGDLPLRRGPDGRFLCDAERPGLLRVMNAVNDIAGVADGGRYWLDMRPACTAGGPGGPEAGGPVLVGLRRKGAANLFLWPAPWLHRIGNDGFPGWPRPEGPDFDDRDDLALWRGGLSGYAPDTCWTELPPSAESLTDRVLQGDAQAELALTRTARWQAVAAHQGMAGIDMAFAPEPRIARVIARMGDALPCAAPPAGHPRYRICLGGTAGDADLMPLIGGQELVLQEETGWEGCMTAIFRPWRHYVPLAPAATDLTDRLEWARRNPGECRSIIARAARLCHRLADPQGRRLHLAGVLADYRAASVGADFG